ncbi:MAG: hypothetical protein DCC68_20375 [Planctomycetota bacterium]|nr:MAG: hypothetical protein DCC68_20375 [Planctomycetota bacterium]
MRLTSGFFANADGFSDYKKHGGPARLAAAAKKQAGSFFNAEVAEDAPRSQRQNDLMRLLLRGVIAFASIDCLLQPLRENAPFTIFASEQESR